MKKYVLPLLALALFAVTGSAQAGAPLTIATGYANDPYSAQIALDSFNYSVRKRFEAVRLGGFQRGVASAPLVRADEALASAPSSRSSSVSGVSSRRQLDCVYYNGFTIWGDAYAAWAGQSNKDWLGYNFDTVGPALGFDWSNGAFTAGIATTYAWGKQKTKSISHKQDVDTWGVQGYFQYDCEKFYANATLGYGYNRYNGTRVDSQAVWYPGMVAAGVGAHSAKYHSNSFNVDAEFGMKFNFKGFLVTPHVGIRYFHDRRDAINEAGGIGGFYNISAGRHNYQVLELPVGVNFGYVINAGGAVIVPQVKFAWIPELTRRRGNVSGWYNGADNAGVPVLGVGLNESAAKRARNGFLLGAGVEAKLTKSLSMHVDYNCNLRNNAYEHHLNLGAGFTF